MKLSLTLKQDQHCPAILGCVTVRGQLVSEKKMPLGRRVAKMLSHGRPSLNARSAIVPVDIQQEESYAPVVCLMEKTWLLPAEKFCKARSTSSFCKPCMPWARCTGTASPNATSKSRKTCSS